MHNVMSWPGFYNIIWVSVIGGVSLLNYQFISTQLFKSRVEHFIIKKFKKKDQLKNKFTLLTCVNLCMR